ncbi:phosphatase PAP2 family protein [Flexivirga sp.]|uniref:phosphatase PAP2 family protein n=1 Tax=Flexivirga sp. TaxID=1962927 RepID=UPI003F7DA729
MTTTWPRGSMSTVQEGRPHTVRPTRGRLRGLAWVHALVMAGCAVLGLFVVVRYAIHSVRGFHFDDRMMLSLGTTPAAWWRILDVLGLVTDVSVALCLAVCVVVAMLQRRWAVAISAGVLIGGANITTQVLKYQVLQSVSPPNTLPSGHTTVGLSLALAAVIVASYRWRPLVTAGAALVATFVGAGTVSAHWHRPGDVLAAGMVCLGWAAVALAIVGGLQRRVPVGRRPVRLAAASVLGVLLAGLAVVLIGVRPRFGIYDLPLALCTLGLLGAMFAIVVGWVSQAVDRIVA